MRPDGIYYYFKPKHADDDDDDGDNPPSREELCSKLSGFFTVFGTTFDPVLRGYTLVLRVPSRSGGWRTVAIPRDVIAAGGKDLARYCERVGLWVSPGMRERTLFQNILSRLRGPDVLAATRTGWNGETMGFVMPDGTVLGDDRERVYFPDDRATQVYARKSGTLMEWQDAIGELVPGNSRLILALCAALASPVMRFAPGVGSTIFNLFGESSRGKSTTAFLYGSVWGGNPERPQLKFAHPWKQTANNAVALCAAHSGLGMVFDELKLCPNPGEIAYAVSLGEEKGRQTGDLQMRDARRWRLIAFSTGEKTLDEAIEEYERRESTSSGTGVRCIDVPAIVGKHGVFECLNGLPSGQDMADALHSLADRYYGHAGPAFVKGIVSYIRKLKGEQDADRLDEMSRRVGGNINKFVGSLNLPDDVDPTVLRVARVFGLMNVTGTLAVRVGVLPLEVDAISDGLRKCFEDWATARGSVKQSAAQRQGIRTLADFISANPGSFVELDFATAQRGDFEDAIAHTKPLHGYTKTINGQRYYLLNASAWKSVVRTSKRGDLVEQLDKLGLLRRANDGGSTSVVKLPGGNVARCYLVDHRITSVTLDGELPAEEPDTEPEPKRQKTTSRGRVKLTVQSPQKPTERRSRRQQAEATL